jgi:hypothetical protein
MKATIFLAAMIFSASAFASGPGSGWPPHSAAGHGTSWPPHSVVAPAINEKIDATPKKVVAPAINEKIDTVCHAPCHSG